jgi:archaellum component FlaC
MVIGNLTSAVSLISQIKERYTQLDNANKKLNQAFQGAKKQLVDIDIEMG